MSQLLSRFDVMQTGQQPDQPGQQSLFWREGANVLFNQKDIQPFPGFEFKFQSSVKDRITGLTSAYQGGKQAVLMGTPTRLDQWVDGTVTELGTEYTSEDWSLTSWGEWWVATNGVDTPQICKAAVDGFADLGDFAANYTTAEIFLRLGNFLLAAGLGTDPNGVAWCDTDNVEIWTPTTTNLAGYVSLRDMASNIVTGRALGDYAVFYSRNSSHVFSFVGAPYVFSQRKSLEGIGAVGKNAVAVVGRMHYGFGYRGIWVSDGYNFRYIDEGSVRDAVYDNLNRESASKVHAVHLAAIKSVIFFYPKLNSNRNNAGVCFNYDSNVWSMLNFGYDTAEDSAIFDGGLVGDSQGNVYEFNVYGKVLDSVSDSKIPMTDAELSAIIYVGYDVGGYGDRAYGGVNNVI